MPSTTTVGWLTSSLSVIEAMRTAEAVAAFPWEPLPAIVKTVYSIRNGHPCGHLQGIHQP